LTRPIPDSYWVVPSLLLAGEYPGSLSNNAARDKLTRLLDAGIRSFVDLTEPGELSDYSDLLRECAMARGVEAHHLRVGVRDAEVPTIEQMNSVLAHISSEIERQRPVYVHCWGGIGRTGTVIACWVVDHENRSPAEATQRIALLREGTPDAHRPAPETRQQQQFIEDWAARREKDAQTR
jgi:hypothetical protein